ncbi:MAG: methyl-accepting chemotaxis protein [Actinobacteria bacterium]|nr:methyl-accepting chemotaxis protein [Actinomycetota bacterium]
MFTLFKKSIRGKLLFLFLIVAIVPTLFTSPVDWYTGIDSLKKNKGEDLRIIALETAKDIDKVFYDRWLDIKSIANDSSIKSPTISSINKTKILKKNLEVYSKYYKAFYLFDLNGNLVAGTDKNIFARNQNSQDWFKTALQEDFATSELHRLRDEINLITFAVPLKDENGGVTGVLAGEFKMDVVQEIVEGATNHKLGDIFVVNKKGLVIADSDSKQILSSSYSRLEAFREALNGKNSYTIDEVEKGKERQIIGYALSNGYKDYRGREWIVFAKFSEKEASSPELLRWVTTTFPTLLFAVMIVGWLAFFLSRAIAKPVSQVSKQLGAIAEGGADLTQQVDVKTEDEIGQLAGAFNRLMGALRGIIKEVLNTSSRVASSAEGLSASAEEVNSSSQQVAVTMQNLARGAGVQAKKVEETFEVMKQMTESIHQAASQAQKAAQSSTEAAQIASTGRRATFEAINKYEEIEKVIINSSNAVRSLSDRSHEIGSIVTVITNIADQTNLLALNAAIEAARAGEYGHGFAVVAEEVRKLAEGSAKAAEQIANLIQEVQSETTKAVNVMEIGAKETETGMAVVNEAGKSLEQIITSVQETTKLGQEIAFAMQQEASNSEQVLQAIEEIASVTEESATSAEETAAAIEEQTASMEEISLSTQGLAELSQQLQELVSKFKV